MVTFLLKNYTLLTHLLEAMAALTGVFLYNKYKYSYTKYFILFLVAITICDFLGGYTRYVRPEKFLGFLAGTIFQKNHWWSTTYWQIGSIIFFAYYYYKILKTDKFKNTIKISGYTFFVFSISYIFFRWNEFFYKFFPIISISGAFIIFLCTVLYFLETLQSNNILTFYNSINFYISAAIFIWWLIITPLVFYEVYYTYDVGKDFFDLDFVFLRRQTYLFSNIYMYSTFTFALIWCSPEKD